LIYRMIYIVNSEIKANFKVQFGAVENCECLEREDQV